MTKDSEGNVHGVFDREANYRIFSDMVNGLVEIHKNEMIHRDIKPENIFIDYAKQDGLPTAKIGDFGLAKLLKGSDDFTTIESESTRSQSKNVQYFSSVAGT